MSPAKALRLSLARTAEDLWDLALAASGISLSREPLEKVIESLGDDGLITLLDGPEGAIGAASFQFPVVSGLVEVQTIGKVGRLAPDPRRVTRTDAAMVAPLIDGAMARFETMLAEAEAAPWARGYRFGSMMDSARMLSLALRATDFHVFRITLDLAATREGEAMLIFPVVEDVTAGVVPGAQEAQRALEAQVMQAPTELRAVLHRVSMPLSAVSALKPGDRLTIPRNALGQTELEGGAQSVLATTRLGQMNGMRAVRLALPGVTSDEAADIAAQPLPVADMAGPAPDAPPPPMAMPDIAPLPDDPPDDPPAPLEMDMLGDLPDLDDLPGLDGDDGGDDLPDLGLADLGAMPMASLPVID